MDFVAGFDVDEVGMSFVKVLIGFLKKTIGAN